MSESESYGLTIILIKQSIIIIEAHQKTQKSLRLSEDIYSSPCLCAGCLGVVLHRGRLLGGAGS